MTQTRFRQRGRDLVVLLAGVLVLVGVAHGGPGRPTLREVPEDDRQYQFLTLGTVVDYLKAERWRIIDQIQLFIPPLYEPMRPFHGYTLPPGAMRVGLSTTFGNNPGDFGTDDFHSLFFENVKVSFLTVDLDVAYGFEGDSLRDAVLVLNIPYKYVSHTGTGHPFRIDPMIMTMEGAGDGIGDVSLTIKKKWLDQGNSSVTLSTFTGVIFPTADDDQQFNASQTLFANGMPNMAVSAHVPGNPIIDIFGRKAGDRLFPRGGQPGNGSWGGRLGIALTRQFERSALHGGAIYDILADNDGITPGDELKYGVSYVFPPGSSDHFSFDLGVFGRWKGDEKFPGTITHPERDPTTGGPVMGPGGMMAMFTTARPRFEHGNMVFFSPTALYVPRPGSRIFVSPSVRVAEPDKGPSPSWMLSVGATTTF